MHIYESAENYLEAILVLKNEKGAVRSIDIAQHLKFSKPSVSRAVSQFRENGLILVDKDGWITLTEAGLQIAEHIYERHLCLTEWLLSLGVSPKAAASDACKIEHDISDETFEKLKAHIKNTE